MTGTPLDFAAWYEGEAPRLQATLATVCGDADLASDCVAEACARALVRWSRVGGMEAPGGWVYKVALNEVRRRTRRLGRERALHERWPAASSHDDHPADLELWSAVAALPDRMRAAVALRYVGDLPEQEIAEALGISRGGVSSLLVKARSRLEERVSREWA